MNANINDLFEAIERAQREADATFARVDAEVGAFLGNLRRENTCRVETLNELMISFAAQSLGAPPRVAEDVALLARLFGLRGANTAAVSRLSPLFASFVANLRAHDNLTAELVRAVIEARQMRRPDA